MHEYLELIEARATGQSMTNAAWIRKFVVEHPEYAQDSVVSDGIAYDLMQACKEIGEGKRAAPELLLPVTKQVGRSVGRLVGGLVGWLVGWSVGRLSQ